MVQFMAEQLRNGLLVGFATDEMPLSRIKRIMKQDALPELQRCRSVSLQQPRFMALASQLFIGLMTRLAWAGSTKPGSRNTLQAKDLKAAAYMTRIFDFLIDVIDDFENASVPELPPTHKPMRGGTTAFSFAAVGGRLSRTEYSAVSSVCVSPVRVSPFILLSRASASAA